ncbi:MAG TPA: hypothetical protein VLB27_03425 [candidate division Zixibacteria bacterium]|nr:hypothetical protein [candidate division Zixibacteria bacterium]
MRENTARSSQHNLHPFATIRLLTALAAPALLALISCSSKNEPVNTNSRPGKPAMAQGSDVAVVTFPSTYSSSASEPDGDLMTLVFHWGDGDSSIVNAVASDSLAEAAHTYNALGSYRIFVVAADQEGLRSDSSDGLRVTVVKPGPIPPSRPFGADTVFVDTPFTFSSTSYSTSADSLYLRFFWGDGQATTTPWDTNRAVFHSSHIWTVEGDYIIRVDAIDDRDSLSNKSLGKTITVINRPPLKPATPLWDSVGLQLADVPLAFSATTQDPEGDDVYMAFIWGDGKVALSSLQNHLSLFGAFHTYNDTGVFNVRAVATDYNGNTSDTSAPLTIHLPEFTTDTIPIHTDGIRQEYNPTQIKIGQGVEFINYDSLEAAHTFISDIPGIFETKLMKYEDHDRIVIDTVGDWYYHCDDHPSRLTEKGRITVLSRSGGPPGRR